jgi:hypothetical protein
MTDMSSTILLLQEKNWQRPSTPSSQPPWAETREVMNRLGEAASTTLRELPHRPETFDCISPFLVQVVYQLATVLVRLGVLFPEEAEAAQANETVETLKTLLSQISPKWRLAGKSISSGSSLPSTTFTHR